MIINSIWKQLFSLKFIVCFLLSSSFNYSIFFPLPVSFSFKGLKYKKKSNQDELDVEGKNVYKNEGILLSFFLLYGIVEISLWHTIHLRIFHYCHLWIPFVLSFTFFVVTDPAICFQIFHAMLCFVVNVFCWNFCQVIHWGI